MAQNDISLMGAVYPDVPAVVLPVSGGGTAKFTDVSDTTAAASDVASGKYFYTAAGTLTEGTASGGGGTTWETIYNNSLQVNTSATGYYYGTYSPWTEDITQGSVWRVTWNNVQYECTATYQDPDFVNYAIGNPAIIGGSQSTNNEPFLLGRGWNGVTNTWNYADAQVGYLHANGNVYTGGVYDDFVYGDVGSVSQGDVLKFYFLYNGVLVAPLSVQYVICYDGSGNAVESAGAANVSTFTVPSGISSVKITMQSAQNQTAMAMKNNAEDPDDYIPYGGGQNYLVVKSSTSQTVSLKIEKQVGGGGSTLITKTITANGTYDATDDDADGYSEVTVAIPAGTAGTPTATKGSVSNHSISVTPSVTNTAGVISGGTINGTAVTVSASELVSGSETKTANGTYDVTNLASLVVNVSGGSGLEYETGTYTPSTNTAQPTISFANSHSRPPVFVCISDTSSTSGITSSSNTSWSIIDYNRINGAGFPYSTSASRYGLVTYSYRGSNNTTVSSVQIQHTSDETGTSDNTYYRYWATASAFKPSSTSTSRYWRSGRNYKWIAVWK